MFKTNLVVGALVASGLCVACGGSSLKPGGGAGSTGNALGIAGETGATGGAGQTGTAGAAGQAGTAGQAGAAGQTGAAGAARDASVADVATSEAATAHDDGGGTGGSDGAGGTTGGASGDIRTVSPTSGCGMIAPADLVAGTLVQQMITTMGTKDAHCADLKCGTWTDAREYWVKLPTDYDKTKAYPLVFEGPGCGGHGNNLYRIPSFDSTVIRVGLTPSAVWQALHSTNPGQSCFDDKEGDDSVDFALYEMLYDKLAAQLCFDRNRVFAAGSSDGATLANELGCKYAGDATRPIRGVMVRSGSLPTNPSYEPTCTKKPMAGIWVHEVPDTVYPFSGNIVAMNRALTVNGCTPEGVRYENATFEPFAISASNAASCKRYMGCPDLAPVVVCPIPGNGSSSDGDVVVPAWTTFVSLFETAPLLTP